MRRLPLLALLFLVLGAETPKDTAVSKAETKPAASLPWADELLTLHKNGKLYDKTQYKLVRSIAARRFAERNAEAIDRILPSGNGSVRAWLDTHPDLRDDLYTALIEGADGANAPPVFSTPDVVIPSEILKSSGPGRDRLPAALGVFRDLHNASPALVEKFPQLAIAIAVTWDQPGAVYDYRYHARRVGAKLPAIDFPLGRRERDEDPGDSTETKENDGYLDGVGNFKALAEADAVFPWTGLPWEFLIFVVDHRTPVAERQWARKYAASQQAKNWYADVHYDNGLLNSEIGRGKVAGKKPASGGGSTGAQLNGYDYTLQNLKARGGVCAHQADFADRVGKSVGVPGFYCSGETNQGGAGHAWWMFAQVKAVQGEKVQFTMESVGRYRGFQFYTGNVIDPQTGQRIKDRDIERRLFSVGQDRTAARHARLLMRLAPTLAEKENWTAKQRAGFLDKVLRICPLCDEAWHEFARLVKEEGLGETNKEVVREHVRPILKTYAAYPDFVAAVLGDFEPVFAPDEMLKLYTQAATNFAANGRADLLCDVRLKATDLCVAQKKHQQAFDGLVETVSKFPTEGRYIPAVTKKLQEVAPNVKGGPDKLAKLYVNFVPQLVAHFQKNQLAQYDDEMYKQAKAYLQENKMDKQLAELKQRCGK